MNKFSPFFLFTGLVLVCTAILLGVSFDSNGARVAQAALPPDHPVIPTALVPTTPNDFFIPGTQPGALTQSITPPNECIACHKNYAGQTGQPEETETWHAWQGSMMAQAGRDPLFFAALDIANADAAGSGEYCLRCHMPRGWLEGRSTTPDGSDMTADDQEGVQCEVCHRMVDPVPNDENPARDIEILAALTPPVNVIASGAMIVDPEDYRRGPLDIIAELGLNPHLSPAKGTLVSPYHGEAALCGTCHDINNPVFTWDETSQSFQPNPLDTPGDPAAGFPLERTFSEWKLSAFNSAKGIYAPNFGGNKDFVATCQDCHMRDVTGAGGSFFGNIAPRDNLPLHDLTGANTWVPQTILKHPEFGQLFTAEPDRATALLDGVERARYMLQNSASLDVYRQGDQLAVTILNKSGHKLPSGYAEGRRMWLQVEGYDAADNLVYSSGAYDNATGVLTGYHNDPTLKVYEIEQGLTDDWATTLGLDPGPSFHFGLNNQIVHDNRIPPQGYNFATFSAAYAAPYKDGQPDATRYADGQFWDTTMYTLPEGVVRGEVRLLYQTASKEYIEFLRDNNPDPDNVNNNGQILYDLWQQTGRSQPEVMAQRPFALESSRLFLPVVERP